MTSPIHVSPLAFLTTAVPSTPPIWTTPEPVVSSALPAARPTVMSPTPVLSSTGSPALSTWISPTPVVRWHSPRRPMQWNVATPASPRTCEPAGRSICTSIDSPPPRKVYCLHPLGALISNRPLAYSTRVCWAAVTSDLFASSLGRTSTMVSVRSLATSRMSPTPSSTVTEIGSGVSKVGIAGSFRSVSAPSPCNADRPAGHVVRVGGPDRFVPMLRWLLARASC